MPKIKVITPDMKTELEADDFFTALIMNLILIREQLERCDPNQWYALWRKYTDELETIAGMMIHFQELNRHMWEGQVVKLPDGFAVAVMPNPMKKNGEQVDFVLDDQFPF